MPNCTLKSKSRLLMPS
ncbi:hypothetical protein LINPERPRIM_LOCUS25227 [Linum perenne]